MILDLKCDDDEEEEDAEVDEEGLMSSSLPCESIKEKMSLMYLSLLTNSG